MQTPSNARRLLVLHESDNVGTALADLAAGSLVEFGPGRSLRLLEAIPFGHKAALEPIPAGGAVVKYGHPIGAATRPIEAGRHVHVHNVESVQGRGHLRAEPKSV